ncbi:MAG: hypothetical protein JWQ71_2955, partial [Pedosphaera sp.]|nr:hypothetical protein [Pedosphaera sp.]
GVTNMTFYLVNPKSDSKKIDLQKNNGCAYLAPIQTIPIRPGTVIDYDVYLRLGPVQEIRNAFYQLHQQLMLTRRPRPH